MYEPNKYYNLFYRRIVIWNELYILYCVYHANESVWQVYSLFLSIYLIWVCGNFWNHWTLLYCYYCWCCCGCGSSSNHRDVCVCVCCEFSGFSLKCFGQFWSIHILAFTIYVYTNVSFACNLQFTAIVLPLLKCCSKLHTRNHKWVQ